MSLDMITTSFHDYVNTKVSSEDYNTSSMPTTFDSFLISLKKVSVQLQPLYVLTNLQVSFVGGDYPSLQLFFDVKDSQTDKLQHFSSVIFTTYRTQLLFEVYNIYEKLKASDPSKKLFNLENIDLQNEIKMVEKCLENPLFSEKINELANNNIFVLKIVLCLLYSYSREGILTEEAIQNLLTVGGENFDESILSFANLNFSK